MTPRDLRNIHTTGNNSRDTLPCTNIALNLPLYFHLLMEKPLGDFFEVQSPYYQTVQCNQKTPIVLKVVGHLPKPVPTDLTIKSDSVLIKPIGKDGV